MPPTDRPGVVVDHGVVREQAAPESFMPAKSSIVSTTSPSRLPRPGLSKSAVNGVLKVVPPENLIRDDARVGVW